MQSRCVRDDCARATACPLGLPVHSAWAHVCGGTSAAAATGMGVLLIEDDDDDALIVEELLAETSLDVRLVRGRTLQHGLRELSGGVECALLDLRLPGVVGLETLRRVHAAAPWIAVIVLTGFDDEALGEAAVDAGAQDYIVKGRVDGALLARAIRYAVGRRHADEVHQQLRVAEIRADENARLERGLVSLPIVKDPWLRIASSYLRGRRGALLGGDFYDAVETVDGCLHMIVGDVSGRGPDGAALWHRSADRVAGADVGWRGERRGFGA